ncbi:MAG: MFS transporter [Tatlockia sp.]|jgi:EmrB/QacA subfamily drug resistance transporter
MSSNTNSQKWWVFLATALAIVMVDIDITAVNLALTTIEQDLDISMSTVQWIVDGYMIAAASLMAFSGKLSDLVGYKEVFLFGLAFFMLASLMVGIAYAPWTLIIGRILQGSCIAFTFPISMVILRSVFPKNQQGFVVGLMVAIAGLAQALGPTFGGIVIQFLNWRYIFYINIPLSLLALVISYFAIPKSTVIAQKIPKKMWAVTLFISGLLMVMTALNEISRWGVGSFTFLSMLLIGMILIGIFSALELQEARPLLDLHLLFQRNFGFLNVLRITLNFVYFTLLFTLSLLLQNIMGYSALQAGFILLCLTLVFGVISIPAGKLVDKIGVKKPLEWGMLLLALSCFLFASVSISLSFTLIVIALILAGIAVGLSIPASGTAVLFTAPHDKLGAAMGLFFTTSFIGSSLGVAISGLMLQILSKNKLHLLLEKNQIVLSSIPLEKLQAMASGLSPMNSSSLSNLNVVDQLHHMAKDAFTFSFTIIMIFCALLSLMSIFFMRKIEIN